MTASATATADSPDLRAELDDRYGRRPQGRSRRRWWIVVVTIAVLIVGYFAWTTVARSLDSVEVTNTAFTLDGPRSVTITFQVTVRGGEAVACAIEAQDTEYGIVGWRVVEYPAEAAPMRSFTETIPTVAEATTGLATACWIP